MKSALVIVPSSCKWECRARQSGTPGVGKRYYEGKGRFGGKGHSDTTRSPRGLGN